MILADCAELARKVFIRVIWGSLWSAVRPRTAFSTFYVNARNESDAGTRRTLNSKRETEAELNRAEVFIRTRIGIESVIEPDGTDW